MVKEKSLYKIIDAVTAPVTGYLPAFMFLCLCLFVPQLYGCNFGQCLRQLAEGLAGNMLLCFFVAYLLILPGAFLDRIAKPCGIVWVWCVVLLCWALAAVDYFIFEFFETHVNAYILQLVNETDRGETSEFFRTYVLSSRFLKVLAFVLCSVILLAVFIMSGRKGRICGRVMELLCFMYLCASLVYSASNIKAFSPDVIENTVYSLGKKVSKSSVFNMYNSFLQFFQEKGEFERCFASQEGIEASCLEDGPEYVVVIVGESHNKYHSSLYGYPLDTNPLLEKTEGLFVFDDVISSVNATSQSFRNFMSLASLDSDSRWYEKPLFPAVFKSAGYNVNFYSNQFVYNPAQDVYDASCGFFNHPAVQDKLFSHKNTEKYRYDGELVDAYREVYDEIEGDGRNLVIFHLSGQHVNAAERYPHGWELFHSCDYEDRKDLDESQKEYVAHYDNATLYNDTVIHEIIGMYSSKDAALVYFSDHGDEVHDFRNHIGRSHDYEAGGSKSVRCQLDIPFLVYMSGLCMEKHPELRRRVSESVHRPFMTDDFPHFLMELAGVISDDFEPSRSLISPEYNLNRKKIPRAINPSVRVDYDAMEPDVMKQ